MPRARKRLVKETEENSCIEESTDLGSTSEVGDNLRTLLKSQNWLSQTCFPGITWMQFGELFFQNYAGTETLAATATSLLDGLPKEESAYRFMGAG